jgi:hypothetical protein
MIHYETKYDLNNGQGWIVFMSAGSGIISAEYNRGTIQCKWDGEILKGEFIDTVSKGQGLIEFHFNENGFNAKWKAGLDEGPMKGKWTGKLGIYIPNNDVILTGSGIDGYKRYISYYLPKEKWEEETIEIFDGENIPSEFITPLGKKYFQELLPEIEVICLDLDNDESAKGIGGNWVYSIIYHIPSGSLLRYNFWEGDTFMEQYFDSKVILLSGYSRDMESYRGLWNIKGVVPRNEDNWDIGFKDNELRNIDNPNVISDDVIERIKNSISAKTIYQFVQDVISFLDSKQLNLR